MSILQTIDLKKYYGTEPNITRALDGVNFSVEDGEFVAVVGTSGSGKSTLLHMMGGLDTPTSGNVIVRDKELSKMNDEQLTIFRMASVVAWQAPHGSKVSAPLRSLQNRRPPDVLQPIFRMASVVAWQAPVGSRSRLCTPSSALKWGKLNYTDFV